jgi:hypothetical protein
MLNMTMTLQEEEGHGCNRNRGLSPCPPLCFVVYGRRTRSCGHLCSPSWVSLVEPIQLLAPKTRATVQYASMWLVRSKRTAESVSKVLSIAGLR